MDPPAGIWLKSCSMLMFLVWQPHWFSCGPNMFWRSTMSNATLEAPLVWFQWTTCCFQFHTTKAMMKPQPLCCSPTQSIVKLEKKVAAADKVHQRLFGLPCVPWCNTNFKLFGFPCLSLYNYQQLKTFFFYNKKLILVLSHVEEPMDFWMVSMFRAKLFLNRHLFYNYDIHFDIDAK